ncbi:hypothetical protein DC20_06945 [Rufibacter tibetensis]|uniref:Uncharacterized protein n=1 Tax=Rufibacter tibetensis TaxID=512763 RepID=A0A0P0CW38_9BACT|nr:hypothetical protein DC20_06945 [Rufibacter tibetensis]
MKRSKKGALIGATTSSLLSKSSTRNLCLSLVLLCFCKTGLKPTASIFAFFFYSSKDNLLLSGFVVLVLSKHQPFYTSAIGCPLKAEEKNIFF